MTTSTTSAIIKDALARPGRKRATVFLVPPIKPDRMALTGPQRAVLRKLRSLKGDARFFDMPMAVGDGTLKSLALRGLIDVRITLTGNGAVQAHLAAQEE